MTDSRRTPPRLRALVGAALLLTAAQLAGPPAAANPIGGFSSPNVEWLGNVSLQGAPNATSGRLVGAYFFVRGGGLDIYDVSEPREPELVGSLPLIAPCCRTVEDLETNGKILLYGTAGASEGDLRVLDVRDKTNPQEIARLEGAGAHTFTCILDCKYAYASEGHIIDLRNPARPQLLDASWAQGLDFHNPPLLYTATGAHDLTEVRPGILLTASTPMYLLDARRDPTRPRVIARSDGSPYSFGGTAWARRGRDRFIVSWSESYQMPRCEARDAAKGTTLDSAFKTWDASQWDETGIILGLDNHYVENGTYVDGEPAFSGAPPGIGGCSASWFDLHPNFHSGGLIAAAASGHGTRFLKVGRNGDLSEVGYFLPHGGNTVAAYWITDEIVYTTDAHRGIDILRFVEETR